MDCCNVRPYIFDRQEKGELTELDYVANGAHDEETDTNGLADLHELLSVG